MAINRTAWHEKTKPICTRSVFGVLSAAKRNLKKQSQFADGHIVVSFYLKGCYEEMAGVWARKNKSKQSQLIELVVLHGWKNPRLLC